MNPDDGAQLWRIKLKGKLFADNFVSLLADGERLFAVTGGYAYCLKSLDGSVVWKQELKDFGTSAIYLFGDGASAGMNSIVSKHNKDMSS